MTATATTIDWLRFRAKADPGEALQALRPLFGGLGDGLALGEHVRGLLGFQRGIQVKLGDATLGRMDWGGESQRGWLRVDLPGKACGFVADWDGFDQVEALPGAELRRLDIALTTWRGEVTHDQVIEAHAAGKFTTRRPPNLQVITNSDGSGRTCYIGKRTADKFFRAYEKGPELAGKLGIPGIKVTHIDGFRVEDIYRCELELKAEGTDIPWETIQRRDQYFSGAYPFCAQVLPGIEPDILQRRPEKAPQRELQAMLANIRTQYGNALFTAMTAHHGDFGTVWERICGREHHRGLLDAGVLLVDHE